MLGTSKRQFAQIAVQKAKMFIFTDVQMDMWFVAIAWYFAQCVGGLSASFASWSNVLNAER
jgi:hypothetical protein